MTVHFNDIPERVDLSGGTDTTLSDQRRGIYGNYLKRILDTVAIVITIPFWLPIIAVFAFIVALDGHKPFYRQDRVGKNGRIFRIWKLRSMVPDAEDQLAVHLAGNTEARNEWAATQKLKDDPRITTLGRFIRRTSIDELPQLLNVLAGDMALVGPRPMLVSQTTMYPGSSYFSMRPGITGMWQVSDRNDCDFKDRAKYDNRYYEQMSLATDVSVLAATVGVVVRCTGY